MDKILEAGFKMLGTMGFTTRLPRQLTKGCDAAAWRCEDESRRGEHADRRESMSSWHSRAAPGSALETGAAAVRSGLLLDDNR